MDLDFHHQIPSVMKTATTSKTTAKPRDFGLAAGDMRFLGLPILFVSLAYRPTLTAEARKSPLFSPPRGRCKRGVSESTMRSGSSVSREVCLGYSTNCGSSPLRVALAQLDR